MNANSEDYKAPLSPTEDRPRNKRHPRRSEERHEEPIGRILDLLRMWTDKGALLVLSLFTLVHLVIVETGRVGNGPHPVATTQSDVQPGPADVRPGPGRSTVSDHTDEPTEVATNSTANQASIDVKQNSDSTSLTRPKGKKRTSTGGKDYSGTSPKVAARSRKLIIEDFKLPLNKVVTFREVDGVVRSRELPSPTVPTPWGNSTARK